jgi:hypothetical protein
MSEDEIVALLNEYAQDSYGYSNGTLQLERANAIARYNQEPWGNEVDGRSQLVSSVLRDTVETVMPQLMRIFLGGDEVCKFDPTGPEDEAGAKQETDYINFVLTQRNDAFEVFSTWFRDALLCKNGYVRASWEKRSDVMMERYQGLPDDAFQMVMADDAVEVTQHQEYPDPFAQAAMQQIQQMPQQAPYGKPQVPQQAPMLHDVVLRRKKEVGKVRLDNIPCEEIRVHKSTRAVNFGEALYVEHATPKTLSEVRQMGYEVPDEWAGVEDDGDDLESLARDRFNELNQIDTDGSDPATRMVLFREGYGRVDVDRDGIAELRKFCLVNDHLLSHDETDIVPIACVTPIIQPHRHIGYGYYDQVKSIEEAQTAMLRSFFDNVYLANNGRYGVDVTKVNVDDMLVSKPGGLVRVEGAPGEAIFPLGHSSTGDVALNAMSFLDNWKKGATGVSLDAQTLSPDVLNKSTASAIDQVVSASQAKPEAVARTFAETGVKELFRIVHHLILQNATSQERAKINEKWVVVDPREWQKRTSLTVTVGLGTGSKQSKIGNLMQLATMQQQGLQIQIANPKNIFETAMELTKEMGYKDGQRFWTDPSTTPQQPKPPDPMVQAAQEQAKGLVQKAQVDAQSKLQVKQAELQQMPAQAGIELQKTQMEGAIEIQIATQKARIEAETKLAIARIHEATQAHIASLQPKEQPRPNV